MADTERPTHNQTDPSYSQEWEHSHPSSTFIPSTPATEISNYNSRYVKRKPVDVTQYDGAGVSLMEEDSPPSPRSTSITPRHTRSVFKSWQWEILSYLATVASLVAFAVVLRIYDGSTLSAWEHDITINSIISILVTIMKASVVVPLAEGLSQLKWVWFEEKERSLKDLVTFDEESRGVLGASKLVLFVKPWHLASIGSVIFLSSFAVGPFSQQVLQIGSRVLITSKVASAPICASYNATYSDIIPAAKSSETTTTATFGAIMEGMFQSSSNKSGLVDVVCPGGNCTFPAYQSLGICHKCADITDRLSYTRNGSKSDAVDCKSKQDKNLLSCVYTLPNELELFGNFVFNSTSDNGAPGPTDAKDNMIFHPSLENINYLMQLTSIKSPGPSAGETTATQCMLYYCVHKYEGRSSIGSYNESKEEVPSIITNDAPGQSFFQIGSNVTVTPSYCTQNGSTKLPPSKDQDQCVYNFYGGTGRALYNTLAKLLVGAVLKNSAVGFQYKTPSMQAMYDNNNTNHSVDKVFKSIANVLTDYMRTSTDICGGSAPGIVSRTEPYMFVV